MVVECDGLLDEGSSLAAKEPQEGVRVRLDVPRMDDLADLVTLANNKKVASQLTIVPHPYTAAHGKQLIADCSIKQACPVAGFAVRLVSTGRLVGFARYASLAEDETVHVGCWIGEPFWGNGYATDAMHALVDHAFSNHDLTELEAFCRVTNPAGRRVLVKSGFQFRDQSMIRSMGAGGPVPIQRFALERAIWTSLKEWGQGR